MTRQRAWQLRQIALNRCATCGGMLGGAATARECLRCSEKKNILARNRDRRKRGIPLDAPLWTRGISKGEK